jgi:hypothetical protein
LCAKQGNMLNHDVNFKCIAIPTFVFLFLTAMATSTFAQRKDSTLFFRSAISVTHNGFSFIPSFSLGKPAAVLDFGVGNKRLSFEPQFRFALEGKPWSFIFIYRYKFVDRKKFQLTMGGHIPAIVFRTQTITTSTGEDDVIISQRFLAFELMPNYQLSKNVNLGLHILQGHGFQSDAARNTTFVGLRANFPNIHLSDQVFVRFVPQVFYLKVDDNDGAYATYTLTLAMKNFPLSIAHIANKAIQTEIVAKDFDWNVSLVYSFDKRYVRQ